MSAPGPLLAAIEAGGTKCWVEVGHGPDRVLHASRVATGAGPETLEAIERVLVDAERAHGPITAIGVAAFGPVRVHPQAPDYACVLATPKPGWQGTDWRRLLRARPRCAFALDTDVNAAALAEARWGAGQGCQSLVYVTVGTGIGGGWVVHGRAVHGALHPELGHLKLRRHPLDLGFAGTCPFHGDCLEGVASGPAILARYGRPLAALEDGHPGIEIVAHALGQLCASLVLAGAERVLLGGGVFEDRRLLPRVRAVAAAELAGYFDPDGSGFQPEAWLITPGLGERSGRSGAFLLAASVLGDLTR
jgi:fructokinase